ncbi:MAG: hypothetical protein GXY19_01415 [Phycisphaerae bacterium]|nr:hypothetical protein [Phycisphaerae bacterium]
MTKDKFVTWFADEVQPRWPTWQVNGVLLNDWYTALGRCDAGTLTQAVQRHAICDSPSQPRINRVQALAREIADGAMRRTPGVEPPHTWVRAAEFWEHVRTNLPREQRITLMTQQIKFDPQARDKDPQAYAWLMEQQAAPAAVTPAPPP